MNKIKQKLKLNKQEFIDVPKQIIKILMKNNDLKKKNNVQNYEKIYSFNCFP